MFVPSIQWRRILVTLTGVLACSYALWVLWYVHSTPDIGLRTALDPEIRRVDIDAVVGKTETSEVPKVGDNIISVNGRPVETWPHLLQALRDLRGQTGSPVKALPEAGDQRLNFIQFDSMPLVRVRFQHHENGQTSVQTCWCRVGPPSEELLASIVWF